MRITLALATALTLCGCAARLLPAGVSGNETFVSVSNVWGPGDGLRYANEHCARYGRIPQFKRMEGHTAIFDCVNASPTNQPGS
jgi:hypothetical protein